MEIGVFGKRIEKNTQRRLLGVLDVSGNYCRSRNLIKKNFVPAQNNGISFFYGLNLTRKVFMLTKTFSKASQLERNQLLKEKKVLDG